MKARDGTGRDFYDPFVKQAGWLAKIVGSWPANWPAKLQHLDQILPCQKNSNIHYCIRLHYV